MTLVLRELSRDVELLLIERASNPRDPGSGQVAIPGGQVGAEDRSLEETALRELEEEVGLARSDLREAPRFVWIDHARQFGVRVAVFATEHASGGRAPVVQSRAEVAHVFWLPCREAQRTERVEVPTPLGPRSVDASVFEGHVLWGFTRRVVRRFLGYPEETSP